MLKKKMLIALGVAAVLSVSCVSVTVWAEENAEEQTEEAEDSSNSEGEEDADLEESDNPEIEEGYTTELEGCTKVVSWCKNGDNNIYGQFYYPEDFDETKTYPVIIMSHGIGSTSQMVERAKWPEKAAQDGIYRQSATPSYYEVSFTGTTPELGSRFFVESCYFKLISKDDRFLLESEVLGTVTNSILPGQNVVPVYEVNGLEACTLGSLYIPGAEEETDDDLRSRWQEKKTGPAQNNNRSQYKVWCEERAGVGRAHILPLYGGENTVKLPALPRRARPSGSNAHLRSPSRTAFMSA